MELQSGLRLLRQRWKSIVLVVVLATVASGVYTWQQTPQYDAEVTFYVSAWASPDDPGAALQGSRLSQQKVTSYAELLRGDRVMSRVAERLGDDASPGALAGQVRTDIVRDTALLVATVRDPSPERAQRVAEALGEEFVALVPVLENGDEDAQAAVTVTVVDPPEVPAQPAVPSTGRNLAVGLGLGVLGGLGLAAVRRALDTTVKTAEQLSALAGAPLLGEVPAEPGTASQPLVVPSTHGPRIEAFRKLRTNLQFLDVDRPHQVLVTTSAAPDEGKSVTAANLAVVLAEAERRVVVVDADLRRPSVASYLGLPNGVGLTSVLLGRAALTDAVQTWGGRYFSVLTSGPVPPNPTTLLSSVAMRELLAELRQWYDTVIVDSPPVLPVADTMVLASACDGVLLVARHNRARAEQVRRTVASLQAADVPVLGTVHNAAPRTKDTYYEYGYSPSRRRRQGRGGSGTPLVGAGRDTATLRR